MRFIALTCLLIAPFAAACVGEAGVIGEACSADAECMTNTCIASTCRPSFEKDNPAMGAQPAVVVEPSDRPNGGVLSGPTLGKGTLPNADLRKPLSVTLVGNEHGVTVESAWLTRYRLDSAATTLARITNTGDDVLCGWIDGRFTDQSGNALDDGGVILIGWEMKDPSSDYYRSCLPPGGSGYLYHFHLDAAEWAPTTGVILDLEDFAPSTKVATPDWQIRPVSYAYDPFEGDLHLVLQDSGVPSGYTIMVFSVLLDDRGEPLDVDLENDFFRANDGNLSAISYSGYRGLAHSVDVTATLLLDD